MPKISVIVPAYNEEKTIVPILERVNAQKIDGVALHGYFGFISTHRWWILDTFGSAATVNPRFVNIYDLVLVQVTRWLETWINPLVGKSVKD